MKVHTELVREPDDRRSNLWEDHGVEECIRIRCRGSAQLPGGTKIRIESREHGAIPKNMPMRIHAAYRRLRESVLDDLRLIARTNAPIELNEKTTDADETGDLDNVRKTLVAQSHGQAAEVFAFIDRLAAKSNDTGIMWAKHPRLGIRGSVTGTPPRISQEARGASFKLDKADWDSDGELDCLCVLGMGHEIDDTNKDADLDTGTVHHRPMAEARRRAANAENEGDAPKEFTMDTAPWGLLVAASDDTSLNEWITDYRREATDGEIEQLTTTYRSIKSWLQIKLAPLFAETIYVDSPGDTPFPEPEESRTETRS